MPFPAGITQINRPEGTDPVIPGYPERGPTATPQPLTAAAGNNPATFTDSAARITAESIRGSDPLWDTLPLVGRGIELWIAEVDTDALLWQHLAQVQVMNGPTVKAVTNPRSLELLANLRQPTVNDMGATVVDDQGDAIPNRATGNVIVSEVTNVAYPPFNGRLYYNPWLIVHSGPSGLFGTARIGKPIHLAVCYRKPADSPYAGLPDFVLMWVGTTICTEWRTSLSNGVLYVDFQFAWVEPPWAYEAGSVSGVGGVITPDPNEPVDFLPTADEFVFPFNTLIDDSRHRTLPPVRAHAPSGAVVASTNTGWTYAAEGLPPDIQMNPQTRQLVGIPRGRAVGRHIFAVTASRTTADGTIRFRQQYSLLVRAAFGGD